jgi:crossover junction endodeoxyribonuclease RuvC
MMLVEHSVKRIRKSVVGNGNATKQQTQRAVEQFLNIPDQKLTLDASDALALALGYGHMNRF